jgi:hypothetical protein
MALEDANVHILGRTFLVLLLAQLANAQSFADLYQPPSISVSPSVPPYSLPLDPTAVGNWSLVTRAGLQRYFDLTKAHALIAKNGFAVTASATPADDIVQPYTTLKGLGIPCLVTADTLLHLYHIQFDETLRDVEEREFYGSLLAMTRALLADTARRQAARQRMGANLRQSLSLARAFYAVALGLLDPNAVMPADDSRVQAELRLINAHAGFTASPLFVYQEDYSQYVPRGHYTRSETLQRYFRAMMWYGQMGFLIRNSEILPAPNADIQTLAACLIADGLSRVTAGGASAFSIWNRIYTVTAFYVGVADDLTPRDYTNGIQAVAARAAGINALSDPDLLAALRAYLAGLPRPQIYGGTGACQINLPYNVAEINACLDKSAGMRFMGQRFVPDSYVFQNLVAMDYLGKGQPFTMVMSQGGPIRGFPRGLDFMDLLGSSRARDILASDGDTAYRDYDKQRQALLDQFAQFGTVDWNRNLYWGWLYALKPLLAPYGPGYPSFMQTAAYTDKNLQSALASWTELRHDTILYAKQSSTPIATALPPLIRGYVEPLPEFYARLAALTRMTRGGLDQFGILNSAARLRFDQLAGILDRLVRLSLTELANKPLADDDYNWIQNIGTTLQLALNGVDAEGSRTTLAADIHTDDNTAQVLEETTGYVAWLAAVIPQPDGSLAYAVGPVMSYYEFKWPASNRLTDEAWTQLLGSHPPACPSWSSSFLH